MGTDRVISSRSEGAGYTIPERNPAHEPIDWFETDYDDQFEDPDEPDVDPLPTARHRSAPS